MTNLLRAELLRWRSRRMIWFCALGVALLSGLVMVGLAFSIAPPSPEDIAQNQQYYREARASWEADHEAVEKECVEAGMSPQDCAAQWPEPRESDFGLQPVTFAEAGGTMSLGLSVLAALGVLLASASFLAAEASTGALANWLSYEPRRGRVFAAKLIVAGAVSALAAALLLTVALAALAVMMAVAQGPDAVRGVSVPIQIAARGVALAGIVAVGSGAVGLLTRHTAAVLGIVVGYMVVQFILAGFRQAAWVGALQPWLPDNNVLAFLQHDTDYYVPVTTVEQGAASVTMEARTLSFEHGLLYIVVALVAVVAVAAWNFRRRDVA